MRPVAIGISWPDVVVNNEIVGGITSKTKPTIEKIVKEKGTLEEYWKAFNENIQELPSIISRKFNDIPVAVANDGIPGAILSAAELKEGGILSISYGTSPALGYIDEEGYVYIMGRVDDIINVAGHRLSTGGMEEVIAQHQDVAECAVIGAYDEIKGEVPFAFFVLKEGVNRDVKEIADEIKKMIRDEIGAIASLKEALWVKRLPKTRSGKILRRILRSIVNGERYKIPSTIDDPAILKEIEEVVSKAGFPKK